ncbi:MAG: hypothetical protein KJO50_01040, partial [Bacteroidia bacterium]|nr:hypothetical protein [Bacteroidia bacterium]
MENRRNTWNALIAFTLCLGVVSIYFYPFVFHPNEHVVTFGGDGFYIHFNMLYHTLYDTGIWLSSMYHPHKELIFMTASQGSLSVILNMLHSFIDISKYVVGISNAFWIFELCVTSVIIFLSLRILNVRIVLSLLFAILIVLLSPQVTRFCSGHYSTAHTLLIP